MGFCKSCAMAERPNPVQLAGSPTIVTAPDLCHIELRLSLQQDIVAAGPGTQPAVERRFSMSIPMLRCGLLQQIPGALSGLSGVCMAAPGAMGWMNAACSPIPDRRTLETSCKAALAVQVYWPGMCLIAVILRVRSGGHGPDPPPLKGCLSGPWRGQGSALHPDPTGLADSMDDRDRCSHYETA